MRVETLSKLAMTPYSSIRPIEVSECKIRGRTEPSDSQFFFRILALHAIERISPRPLARSDSISSSRKMDASWFVFGPLQYQPCQLATGGSEFVPN